MNLNQLLCRSFLLLSISASQIAFAQNNFDPSWVQGQVLQEALAATKTLDKDYVVYHWVKREYVSANESQLPRRGYFSPTDAGIQTFVKANMKSRMDLFWDLTTRITGRNADGRPMAPNGLYVAINPIISKQWGDTLYQMTLSNGMRFIDGRSYRNLGNTLQSALRAKGCSAVRMVDLIRADTGDTGCRKSLAEIALATQSMAVMYQFNREPLPNCDQWSPALVMINLEGIKDGTIAPMSPPDVPQNDDGLNYARSMINAMFRLSLQTGVLPHQPPFRASPALQNIDEAAARQYAATHYYGCKVENQRR